jgi:RNase P subunit RPR2
MTDAKQVTCPKCNKRHVEPKDHRVKPVTKPAGTPLWFCLLCDHVFKPGDKYV